MDIARLQRNSLKLTILEYRVELTRNDKYKHKFKCFCGKEFIAIGADVNSGRTKSCGCYAITSAKNLHTTHGLSRTPEHRAWMEMRRRCFKSTRPGWEYWGGRGISICERWAIFDNFIKDMGLKPSPYHSLDRIDNDKNYSPENCRWADRTTQSRNQRRHKNKVWPK